MAKKQAVLLIHGIGEQVPMATLRSFVDAVWRTDSDIHNTYGVPDVWSKPDDVSGSYELRRLTTGRNRAGIRTDFFEYYWAHLVRDTTMAQITGWLRLMLFRSPSRVPAPLRPVWWLSASGLVAALALYLYGSPDLEQWLPGPPWVIAAAGSLVAGALGTFLIHYVGDAARYLHGAPDNVGHRQHIRGKGIALLRKLQDSGDYERIIVVGHSLGSVIGYDILTYLWADRATRPPPEADATPVTEALDRLVALACTEPLPADDYRAAQRVYLDEIRANGSPWLVTDFITLGSPLTYAELLLAKSPQELAAHQQDRELPTCPPILEAAKGGPSFAHKPPGRRDAPRSIPHHAAIFAPTRWTNLYFPVRRVLRGDPIAGPLAPVFGAGIRDVPVETSVRGEVFSHTLYWTMARSGEATDAVRALRAALNLADEQALSVASKDEDLERVIVDRS